jgi:hypothetical protein
LREAGVSVHGDQAVGRDDQQLYGGTQSALSTTLLLWTSESEADAPGFVENRHSAVLGSLRRSAYVR